MKKAVYIFTILFFGCINKEKKETNIEKNEIVNSLPIGKEILISQKLPNEIIYQYDEDNNSILNNDNILDSIISISSDYYDDLQIDRTDNFKILPEVKKGIIYNKLYKTGMIYYLDSCYYAKTIFNNGKLKLKLFKDGNKYRNKLGYENTAIIKYLILGAYNNYNKLIDYKLIYYNESFLYANNSRCFFLDKKMNLHMKDYSSDEEKIFTLLDRSYHIDTNGKFTPQPTTKISSKSIDKKVDLTNKTPVGSWQSDCKSNYRYFQIDEENNKVTLEMEPNNFYIYLEEKKEKRKNGKFFYKIKYVEGIAANDVYSEDFINENEVVIIQVIDQNSIEFKWLGFYDNISKKRINKDCPFGEDGFCDEKPIILKQCDELK